MFVKMFGTSFVHNAAFLGSIILQKMCLNTSIVDYIPIVDSFGLMISIDK